MPSNRTIAVIVIAALLALAGARVDVRGGRDDASPAGGFGAHPPRTVRVVRIVDGDTIAVESAGRRDVVRYIGIDTPESVKPHAPVECFGKAAGEANARLVEGRSVRLVLDAEPRDRFGRLLAYVYRAQDGLFVNERLLRRGFARTLRIRPNVHFANRFSVLQNVAKSAGRGLWAAC